MAFGGCVRCLHRQEPLGAGLGADVAIILIDEEGCPAAEPRCHTDAGGDYALIMAEGEQAGKRYAGPAYEAVDHRYHAGACAQPREEPAPDALLRQSLGHQVTFVPMP